MRKPFSMATKMSIILFDGKVATMNIGEKKLIFVSSLIQNLLDSFSFYESLSFTLR